MHHENNEYQDIRDTIKMFVLVPGCHITISNLRTRYLVQIRYEFHILQQKQDNYKAVCRNERYSTKRCKLFFIAVEVRYGRIHKKLEVSSPHLLQQDLQFLLWTIPDLIMYVKIPSCHLLTIQSNYLRCFNNGYYKHFRHLGDWLRRWVTGIQFSAGFWGPPSHLSNGYWGSFPGGKAAGAWTRPLASI